MFALPFIESGVDDIDLDIEVAGMMSGRFVSFACEFDICARPDACGYFDVYELFGFFQSSVGQWFAVFRIDFSATAAGPACSLGLHDAERGLDLLDHATMAIAGLAFLLLGPGDFLHPAVGYLFGRSCVRIFETDVYGHLDVFSALGAFSPRSSAESPAENTSHKVADVKISEVKTALAALTESAEPSLAVESRISALPIRVVLGFFLFVADDLIGLVHLLELLFVASSVRMMLDRSLFEGLFDLFGRSVLFDAQDIVIILFYIKIHENTGINE